MPAAYIDIDRTTCRLSLFLRKDNQQSFSLHKRYKISVGVPAYPTPTGLFAITVKSKDPVWKMPNSPWVPVEKRGKLIPGGSPDNPLIARWMKVIDGVGIHGTRDLEHIGQPASHGCIRMRPVDVIEVYRLTPKFSIVNIHDLHRRDLHRRIA
jgi:lipoprotein-anchoring transpeptidase ErfK/SrfK